MPQYVNMKTCFICGIEKPFSEFYRHPMMGDGHLGKCKDCTKQYAEERRKRLEATDLEWVLAERLRHRGETKKARASGRCSLNPPDRSSKYDQKYPEKYKARTILGNALRAGKILRAPCEVCGNPKAQGHHDDYSKPLDVRWLCVKHHNEHHVKIREQQIREKFQTLS